VAVVVLTRACVIVLFQVQDLILGVLGVFIDQATRHPEKHTRRPADPFGVFMVVVVLVPAVQVVRGDDAEPDLLP
jgi:hypothetical protein